MKKYLPLLIPVVLLVLLFNWNKIKEAFKKKS